MFDVSGVRETCELVDNQECGIQDRGRDVDGKKVEVGVTSWSLLVMPYQPESLSCGRYFERNREKR